MDIKTLESKKISDLRVIAQTVGIDASNMKKDEIIAALTGNTPSSEENNAPKKRGRKPKEAVSASTQDNTETITETPIETHTETPTE
ncbi:MAG: Rho termination factor N-terminal domain-containing protein, partial [Flavobacteriales bacterium]